MTGARGKAKIEYLDKEKARQDAPRLPGAFATERLLSDSRGDFSFDGHRLSSLYRGEILRGAWLIEGYVKAFSLRKYSTAPPTGVTTPEMIA